MEIAMAIHINGEPEDFKAGSVASMLRERELDPDLVVVELNGQIITQDDYNSTELKDGDSVEIVQFVSGG